MKQSMWFFDDLSEYSVMDSIGNVVHTLCIYGSMSFTINHVRYNVSKGDLVIFLNGVIVSDIRMSDDFNAIVMMFSESFYNVDIVRNNYSIVGHISLMTNPVMRLTGKHFEACLQSMVMLRNRNSDMSHLFHDELIGALLKAHVLEIHNSHAKMYSQMPPESRQAVIMGKFISMLEGGEYIQNRNLAFYADKLCITPHYLSDVSKSVSGRPTTYWIDKFLIQDILKRLADKGTSLTEIADGLNFSSISYLSRFIKKHTGFTPSELRQSIHPR